MCIVDVFDLVGSLPYAKPSNVSKLKGGVPAWCLVSASHACGWLREAAAAGDLTSVLQFLKVRDPVPIFVCLSMHDTIMTGS